jgi:hypothetical protein
MKCTLWKLTHFVTALSFRDTASFNCFDFDSKASTTEKKMDYRTTVSLKWK